ncbi:hypothetical protein R70723_03475 [Paenibacillus sp. FSL R7-0273]|uniref:ClbS/DfsB family four-helix bundle protein n=1 Tax=Paenibacillus sp. FSL R7-0273 TaxID=1536772 RepID=UPI0004F66492|nr:ClbS/DfsB family four-helix bundle protein [Paenibacillus sp. FSL R7-0273]AIQ45069.1 hypothetical protein R70723_03475 [Paenibacillus sp. FSL R7-0273]OMF84111.1 hypothetical protein BK144_30840 [Paenibacillus sp. FSL R7-0273]
MASYEYGSKQELLDTIHTNYILFDAEFTGISDRYRNTRISEVDKTPGEIIAYQLGWLHLVMGWDKAELAGQSVPMPSTDYKWNQLGGLYQSFYKEYESYTLTDLRGMLRQVEQEWLIWVGGLTEEELFTQEIRAWTGSKDNWPMARWIHINSAAPFKTFRAKIRKWKKHVPAE